MYIDESGHDPGAARINLGGSARHLLAWTDGQDAIVANDDVDIALRRAAVSIDQRGAAHDDGRALRGLRLRRSVSEQGGDGQPHDSSSDEEAGWK